MSELSRYNEHRGRVGQPPLAPQEKYKKQRGLNMSEKGWEGLRELAREKGYSGTNGPNITQLLEAIGHRLWVLERNTDDATPPAEK